MNYKILNIPTKWAICPCCDGEGKVENPAFSNGFTGSEWAEMCDERDDQTGESYARKYLSGQYDKACKECGMTGKVRVPVVEMLSFAQKRILAGERRDKRIGAIVSAEMAAERAAEARMGG